MFDSFDFYNNFDTRKNLFSVIDSKHAQLITHLIANVLRINEELRLP